MVDTRKVKVDFSLEDMDLSEFKGAKGPGDLCLARIEAERRQAAYEQIKAYVLQQTGLKVSSLYIAQERKTG